jgi:uncharacterized membrane protein YebE (DUF533 family)
MTKSFVRSARCYRELRDETRSALCVSGLRRIRTARKGTREASDDRCWHQRRSQNDDEAARDLQFAVGPSSCMVQGMKRAKPDSAQLATQAAQSLAVAVALVFLAHMVFWMAAQSATVADESGEPPQSLLDAD